MNYEFAIDILKFYRLNTVFLEFYSINLYLPRVTINCL